MEQERPRSKTRRAGTAGLAATVGLLGCPGPTPVDPCVQVGVICTVVGTGNLGFNGDGLPADETWLYWPAAVRFDPDGHLVVADLNNFRVRRVRDDGTVETLLGTGFHLGSTEGLRATDSPVDYPVDVRFLPDGTFLVAATHEARVLYVDAEGYVEWIVGTGNVGYAGDGGPAEDAQLSAAAGIARADDGVLYIADTDNHCIRAVGTDGIIRSLAGRGLPGFGGDGGPAEGALLHGPTGLTLDGDTLYVADSGNHVIRAVDLPSGTIRTVAGLGARGYSGDGGDALAATFFDPEAVAIAGDGALWIADAGNNVVRRVGPDGVVSTEAGTGEPGFAGDGGPAVDATFTYPTDLVFDPAGDLYVADMADGAVRVVRGATSW